MKLTIWLCCTACGAMFISEAYNLRRMFGHPALCQRCAK
jgi:hypothetical protein